MFNQRVIQLANTMALNVVVPTAMGAAPQMPDLSAISLMPRLGIIGGYGSGSGKPPFRYTIRADQRAAAKRRNVARHKHNARRALA